MIVIIGPRAQVLRVSGLTGGMAISHDGKATSKASQSGDFERNRKHVESTSVLFKIYDDTGEQVPSGWTPISATFEAEWPKDSQAVSWIQSHFGARWFSCNWVVATLRGDMDAKKKDKDQVSTPWTRETLRKRWNQAKDAVAPWRRGNSKECYSSGIADPLQALSNWSQSKASKRIGKIVGFLKFARKNKDPGRVRFTAGTKRLKDDRRIIMLPTIGVPCSKENARRVQHHLAKDDARLLNCTLSER